MDARRKTLGRRIKRARLRAGYRSQKAFADAIGISDNSVARAETGDERVGESVFVAIEGGLPNWPDGVIERFLATGDDSLLPSGAAEPEPEPGHDDDTRAEIDELHAMALTFQEQAENAQALAHQMLDRIDRLRQTGEGRAAR